jgi:hypothetical protein
MDLKSIPYSIAKVARDQMAAGTKAAKGGDDDKAAPEPAKKQENPADKSTDAVSGLVKTVASHFMPS